LASIAGMAAAGGCGTPGTVRAAPPPIDCCRELDYLYEASIFKIDVMRIRLRVDDATASAVRSLVGSAPRSTELDRKVATRYIGAAQATVETEFKMSMSGGTFISNTTKAIQGLARDGLLEPGPAEALGRDAQTRFAFLHEAGVREGDRIRYELVADTVTTQYLRGETVLMRDRQVGTTHRVALLASYFAPSSDFRRGLLDRAFGG
jgi:hypothetical protein